VAPRGEGGAVLEHLRDQQPATTPLDVARQLRAHARAALDHAGSLDPGSDRELRQTLGDAVAMAHLGNYYAAKIEGAVALYLLDKTGQEDQRTAAVASLEEALNHWRSYAAAAGSQYQPQRLNRIGLVDLNAVTAYVEQDVNRAREWQPGTLAKGN
jgi:hypothetical protein